MTGGPFQAIPIERVFRASAAIFLAALLVSLRFDSLAVSAGVAAGTAITLAILWSWRFMVARAFDPRSPNRALALAVGFAKLPVIGAAVYFLVTRQLVSAPALVAGMLVPQVAVALVALGKHLSKRDPIPAETTEAETAHAAPRH